MKSPQLTPQGLPVPDAIERAHVEACEAMLRAEIHAAGGWISFARYMELALYAPGLGYYAAGARKFGAAGDFVTAPEISSLFGRCIARSMAATLTETGGEVFELGPGSGKLACDVLTALDAMDALPAHYYLLEVSADLRERQQAALATLPAHLSARAVWLDRLPENFDGVIIANEVLDVIPVHLVVYPQGLAHERGVSLENNALVWRDIAPISEHLKTAESRVAISFSGNVPDGYLSEISPACEAWVASLATSLRRGMILLIDYGFRRAEFYHPSRRTGTLMCHYRHRAHADPFFLPGLQDITAHVDFTTIAEAGIAAGLTLDGYTSQAQFLIESGITDFIIEADPADTVRYLQLTNQAQRLLSPAEMGEFFKVIGFSKGCNPGTFTQARPLPL